LFKAAIYGRPIVFDINRSCFLRNEEGIVAYGTAALNITGSYSPEVEGNMAMRRTPEERYQENIRKQ
jgi:hypothetical protein